MARLTRSTWLDHGLETLASGGFTMLKADLLAKGLGVSRGSFYWHFTDLADYHQAVLNQWLEVVTESVIEQLSVDTVAPIETLENLITMASRASDRLEFAVRAWAFHDPAVAELVNSVDNQRLAFISDLLIQIGLDAELAQRRAALLYLSSVGKSMVRDVLSEEQIAGSAAEILRIATQ